MRGVARTELKIRTGQQIAALPWRGTGRRVEILLITTRNTGRWIIPKGWSLEGLPPHQSAAHEAMEEAGISGEIAERAFGSFSYTKVRKSGEMISCKVAVYPLHVSRQARRWPEKGIRQICWCSPAEALSRVREPGLRRLIARFAATAANDA